MLTKEERAAIAERFGAVGSIDFYAFYTAVTGKEVATTSYHDDLTMISNIILDLCDTSNMIELPRDKDGKVICPGDTVYVDDDMKYKVAGYMMRGNGTEVILAAGAEPVYTKEPANNITHKKPGTTAALSEQIRNVIDKGQMTAWAMAELFNIVDQLESLSDKDE